MSAFAAAILVLVGVGACTKSRHDHRRLCARGTDPLRAGAWAGGLHARAGEKLARKTGRLGYLAREIADEIPALLR